MRAIASITAKNNLKLLTFLFLCLISPISHQAFAVDIVPVNQNVKVVEGSSLDGGLLVINESQNGISYNVFSKFNLAGDNLRIFNGAKNNDLDVSATRLIIIQASDINLSGQVEVIGAPADILFITNSKSRNVINCHQCSFKNVGRLTLASAKFLDFTTNVFATGAKPVGRIASVAYGRVSVDGLTAPGMQSLEIIGRKVATKGSIDTNLRAFVHEQGGHIIHPDGNKLVGAGGINLYIGQVTLGYDDLALSSASSIFHEASISGKFRAATVSITSPDPISLKTDADISTLSDFVSTSVRPAVNGEGEGSLYVPIEGIFIQGVNRDKSRVANDINIYSKLATDGKISIKSLGDIKFHSSVLAKDVVAIAKNTIWNKGSIQATKIEVGSSSFINNSSMSAQKITVEAAKHIYNSFGGEIGRAHV